jgi:hypothetical protein
LKNVLLAPDFSSLSETALLFAESVARRSGPKLITAHAISSGVTDCFMCSQVNSFLLASILR